MSQFEQNITTFTYVFEFGLTTFTEFLDESFETPICC